MIDLTPQELVACQLEDLAIKVRNGEIKTLTAHWNGQDPVLDGEMTLHLGPVYGRAITQLQEDQDDAEPPDADGSN